MRISDWSSDVCSSDLGLEEREAVLGREIDPALKRGNGVQKHERLVAASKGFRDEFLTFAIGVEKAPRPGACHPAIGDKPGEGFPRADFPRPGHRGKARTFGTGAVRERVCRYW